METIRGKMSLQLDPVQFRARLAGRRRVALDLGTGDGRYVCTLAERYPDWFVIGLDACRENLQEQSRRQLPNALFVIAGAERLPDELSGLVSILTINFPWGSLLDGLLTGDPAIMEELRKVAGEAASIELRLNGGALAEAGCDFEDGVTRIRDNLLRCGWHLSYPSPLEASGLKAFPSTWARRLAHGRDPRAVLISGRAAG